MVQPWHGLRGGRGRNVHQRAGAKLDQRSLVWTPALAASNYAVPSSTGATSAPPSGSTSGETVTAVSEPSSRKNAALRPIMKAKMSVRKAAEAVEAASKKSLEEIEANLELSKSRLEEVIRQEKEVKAIVDEHLKQEAMLQELLDRLYRRQRDEAEVVEDEEMEEATTVTEGEEEKVTETEKEKEATAEDFSSQEATRRGPSASDANNSPAPFHHDTPGSQSATPSGTTEPNSPTRDAPAPRVSAPTPALKTQHVQKSTAGAGGRGGSRVPGTARGGGSAHVPLSGGSRTAGPGMFLAMAIGGGEDGLLTRDAATMEEFMALMSAEALAEEGWDKERYPASGGQWHQPGLSISEALDRASGHSGRAPRPPNLLTLANHVRPLRAATRTSAAIASGKRKTQETTSAGATGHPGTAKVPGSTEIPCAEAGVTPTVAGGTVRKRRRVDPNAIMCPFELGGVCNDDDCRYQHMDVYLPASPAGTPVASGGIPWSAGEATSSPSGDNGLKDPRTGPAGTGSASSGHVGPAGREERSAQRDRYLPEIQFDEPPDPEPMDKRDGERGPKRAGVPPEEAMTESDQRSSVKEAEGPTTRDSEHGGSSPLSGSTGDVDGNILMTEEATGQEKKIAQPQQGSDAAAMNMTIGEIAKSFAQAMSVGSRTEDARSSRGRGGGRREERYYHGVEQGSTPTAADALTKDELQALEKRLVAAGCDVEGWLLLAMHRLPRSDDSAAAVLNTVKDMRIIGKAPSGTQASDAALKAALRVLVRGLERSQQGKAEELWMMYLCLFARVPNLGVQELVNMAEDVLDNFPSSRRTWKLTRSIVSASRGRSLTDTEALYRDRLQSLLQMPDHLDEGAGRDVAVAATGALPPGSGTASEGQVSSGEELVGMMLYLVLERAALLAVGGYVLQAIIQVLDALGERNALRSCLGEGDPETQLLRLSSALRHEAEGRSSGEVGGTDEVGGELPEGVAAALRKSPPGARCLLWLTALHLLVMGTFPVHVLDVAEGFTKPRGGGNAQSTSSGHGRGDCSGLLRWPEYSVSPQSTAGRRLAASDELRNATTRTFMSALKDAALLPDESGGGRWAPPFRIPDALIPSTDEAAGARAGGMAPEPGALEGPGLVLALNWLTFCCRGEKGKQQEVRTVALACCRRFQLARPDHPALLAHNLLEHHASKARPLDDIFREISEAFDTKGAAAEAIRDRGEIVFPEELEDGGLTPSGSRLEAVYAFLRFIEAREVTRDVFVAGDIGGDNDGVVASATSSSPAKKTALNAEAEAARDEETEATRAVVHGALISLWVKAAKPTSDGQATASVPERWLREENGEPVRRAVEGAKASLFRWADGRRNARNVTHDHEDTRAKNRKTPGCDYLGAGRQLSVLFAALWVLGGPSTASGALDHLLSADSFSGMSPERRRLSWLHRLEVAIVLSESDVRSGGQDSVNAVREVALRALADHRARPRPEYCSLAQYIASTLEAFNDEPPPLSEETRFVRDILRIYADHFQAVRGGVDWVVVAEALGSTDERRGDGVGKANPSQSAPAEPHCVLELLRWVDQAGRLPGTPVLVHHSSSPNVSPATLALLGNARPYARRALKNFPGDAGLAGVVAALEVAMGHPGNAQRVLEAAVRRRPESSALWEQRIALEAAFGAGSRERASVTAGVAASTEVLLRLRCPRQVGVPGSSVMSSRPPDKFMTGRVLAAIGNPSSRTATKSLSLQGPHVAAAPSHLPPEIPRTVFLLTELVSLSLAGNMLTTLPAALGRLLSLRALDVSGNMLTTLPPTLSRLSGSLRILRLAGNRLASPLPLAPVGKLVNIRLLDLEGNSLSEFPMVVLKMLELKTLKLSGNPFAPRVPPGLSDTLLHLEEVTLPSGSERVGECGQSRV